MCAPINRILRNIDFRACSIALSLSPHRVLASSHRMADTTEDWADTVAAVAEPPTVEVKLFGKWNPDEIHVNDISLAVSVYDKNTVVCFGPCGRLYWYFSGLYICEGERSQVSASHCWSVCSQEVQEGPGMPQKYILISFSYHFNLVQCPIVERLANSLMMHGRNNGKKLMAVRIVKHAFEIIHLLTGEVRPNREILDT